MWEDKGLYWAWRGEKRATTKPPYTKVCKYAGIYRQNGELYMQIAYTIIDGGVERLVHQDEILKFLKFGYILKIQED